MVGSDHDLEASPRRCHLDKLTPAEIAIRSAMLEVEKLRADVRLTDAVNLLQAARDSVADFFDGIDSRRFVSCQPKVE